MKVFNTALIAAMAIIVFLIAMAYVVVNNQALNTGLFAALMIAGCFWMLLKVGVQR
ncbi:hypothetical protein [Macrococcus equipercicus]|uniref:Uncharacterized protein n=1 Tax=Macrococcus equipercicus TaxID=69967 RepID=A0A9Q9F2T9_9STAP|nr:hypothetical protein [Macrococcus equipercicus]UTH14741.1 hypothetical protein KFV11_05155 [Macrococcus equipercicus]